VTFIYVVVRGLTDSDHEPQTENVGVFATLEAAEEARRLEAPNSGTIERWELDKPWSSEWLR
jgi:hypothetical protein